MADVKREAAPGAISMVEGSSLSEANKEIVRRFLEETLMKRNMAILYDLAAEDLIVHHPTLNHPLQGREAYKQFLQTYFTAFPTWEIALGEAIGEANKVAIPLSIHARGQGNFHGVDAMGKDVHWSAVRIEHLAGGKITETWTFENSLALLDGLGVNPLGQT